MTNKNSKTGTTMADMIAEAALQKQADAAKKVIPIKIDSDINPESTDVHTGISDFDPSGIKDLEGYLESVEAAIDVATSFPLLSPETEKRIEREATGTVDGIFIVDPDKRTSLREQAHNEREVRRDQYADDVRTLREKLKSADILDYSIVPEKSWNNLTRLMGRINIPSLDGGRHNLLVPKASEFKGGDMKRFSILMLNWLSIPSILTSAVWCFWAATSEGMQLGLLAFIYFIVNFFWLDWLIGEHESGVFFKRLKESSFERKVASAMKKRASFMSGMSFAGVLNGKYGARDVEKHSLTIASAAPTGEALEAFVRLKQAGIPLHLSLEERSVAFAPPIFDQLMGRDAPADAQAKRSKQLKGEPIVFVVEGSAVAVMPTGKVKLEPSIVEDVLSDQCELV